MKQFYRNAILCLLVGATLVGCGKKVADPKPNVSVMTEEGYTTGEKHFIIGGTLKFGFDATSNPETAQKLAKFQVLITQAPNCIYDTIIELNNNESFHFEDEFTFVKLGDWRIVGRAYDAAGEINYADIFIHVQEDMEEPFVWQQIGQDSVTGFNDYGLLWIDSKVIDSVAIALDTICLLPADDSVSLYLFDKSKWDEIDTYKAKDDLFKDIQKKPKDYKDKKIDAYNILAAEETVTYDNVIAIMNENENGQHYLLFIGNSFSEDYHGLRHLTVNGKLK